MNIIYCKKLRPPCISCLLHRSLIYYKNQHGRYKVGLMVGKGGIKLAGPLAASPADHFIQFCDGFGTAINQTRRRCWWIALTSTIWQHRNSLVFQGKSFDPPKVMEDSLFLLWSWLKTRDRHFSDSFNYWSSNIVRYFG